MSVLANGRYRMGAFLAEGGMQKVFLATDLVLNLAVVLKTPKDGQALKKFANSAKMSAMINHHNVARTLDYFEEDGRPYLVEEYVQGQTLEEACLLDSSFVDPHSAARLFILLSKALQVSHKAGVIHRDIKPSNVLVSGKYALTEVKISDFGIATLTDAVFQHEIIGNKDITKTTNGTIKGALPYMAPEMLFRKKGDAIGPEADIWSLAAVMFKAMTGNLPFGEDYEVPANIGTRGDIIQPDWPDFPFDKPAYAELAKALKSIIASCFARDRTLRPTAENLVKTLTSLPYYKGHWQFGRVNSIPPKFHGYVGFISSSSGDVMYHIDSLYGSNQLGVGDSVWFCASDGYPNPRAFPLVKKEV